MRKWASRIAALMLVLMTSSCASARFPLCPKLAGLSYQGDQTRAIVNGYLLAQAQERRVKISPMSAFSAKLSGSKRSLAWFQKNYAFMLCAYDPKKATNDEQLYLVCMKHAQEWVSIVQSKEPENLLLKDTHFADVCVE